MVSETLLKVTKDVLLFHSVQLVKAPSGIQTHSQVLFRAGSNWNSSDEHLKQSHHRQYEKQNISIIRTDEGKNVSTQMATFNKFIVSKWAGIAQ